MDDNKNNLSPNSLAFIALANEYCHAVENVSEYEHDEFVAMMLKLLPRIYIAASDIKVKQADDELYIDSSLDEFSYDNVKDNMSRVIGENDIYLEVFMEDMKYSDTPISSSISENLADIYQSLYNFVASVKDSANETANGYIYLCKSDFDTYWGQTLCNVLRALHSIYYNTQQI